MTYQFKSYSRPQMQGYEFPRVCIIQKDYLKISDLK